jgi:hypothetical protein
VTGARNLLPRLAALDKLIAQRRKDIRALEQRVTTWEVAMQAAAGHAEALAIATRAAAKAAARVAEARADLHLLFRARATARRASPTASRYLRLPPAAAGGA